MIVKKDFLEVYNFNTGFFKQYRHQRQKKTSLRIFKYFIQKIYIYF